MAALDHLVEGLFDYAGMFPPAALSFEAALRTSARLSATLRRPGLVNADMVVKREHLGRMTHAALAAAGFADERTVRTCLVGVPLGDAAAVLAEARSVAQRVGGPDVSVVSLEVVVEEDVRTVSDLGGAVADVAGRAAQQGASLYVEPRWPEPAWRDGLDVVVRLLGEVSRDADVAVGLKVRCAGPTALGPATLAPVVQAIAAARVPLKATQGLHHPLVETSRYGNTVGFLGLVAALRLAEQHDDVSTDLVAACIAEADAAAFAFSDGSASWRGRAFDVDNAALPFQVGSCSLDEPDADLVRLFG